MTFQVCRHHPGGEIVLARRDDEDDAKALAIEYARHDPAVSIVVRCINSGVTIYRARVRARPMTRDVSIANGDYHTRDLTDDIYRAIMER